MAKSKAVWKKCVGYLSYGAYVHAMRDGCWSCAPWWEDIPTCPTHGGKLAESGFCAKGRHYLDLTGERESAVYAI